MYLLKFQKTAQIKHNTDLNASWQDILEQSSMVLNKTLIKSHERNAILLSKKLTALRDQVLQNFDEATKMNFSRWLQEESISYRERTHLRKQKKFDQQVSKHRDQHQSVSKGFDNQRNSRNCSYISNHNTRCPQQVQKINFHS